jgi:hypothetical protein
MLFPSANWVVEPRRDAVDRSEHGIAIRDGDWSAGAEVALYVDDEENILQVIFIDQSRSGDKVGLP